MAQEVERILGKDEVTSSTLVSSSKTKSTSSEVLFVLEMKRSLREQEDAYANESAFAYEVLLRNDKERFASYSRSECFIEAEPLLHTSESECFT